MHLFVDTNAFLFLLRKGKGWEKIAEMLDSKENDLHTSLVVLNELKFKLLWIGASESLRTEKKHEILRFIKADKDFREKTMKSYLEFYFTLLPVFKIHPLSQSCEIPSIAYSSRYGLLPTDTYILATMKQENIFNILTNDKDFDSIPEISVLRF
ncbi:MAG: PIN domain-containing protein [Candidatus Aenigmarchaeota archaeon]|nr:PIN domain-containing protein [Candidatus Aenigmarchaeota archaeon]